MKGVVAAKHQRITPRFSPKGTAIRSHSDPPILFAYRQRRRMQQRRSGFDVCDDDALKQMSVIELKEMLHKRNIDSTGIFDPSVLLRLIRGEDPYPQLQCSFPASYMRLFDVELLFPS